MYRSTWLQRAAALWLSILVATGCAAPTPTPTPVPTATSPVPTLTPFPTLIPGPSFEGRLFLKAGSSLLELAGTSSSAILLTPIANGVGQAAVSPNQRYLAYSTYSTPSGGSDETFVLDLDTGQTIHHEYHGGRDLRWSPDSRMLSFTTTIGGAYGLYVSDLSGTVTLIHQPPSAIYRVGVNYQATTVYGEVTAGTWLDATHLLFRRYLGDMPFQISAERSEIAPNTLTVVSLEDGPVLRDYPDRRLLVQDICYDGSWILFRDAGQGWWLARAAASWEDINPTPFTPCPDCGWGLGFVPGSCDLWYVHAYSRNNHFYRYIYFASPDTLEARAGPALEIQGSCPNMPGRYCNWDWDGVWVGDPAQNVIAVIEKGWQNGTTAYFISVVDLNTTGVTRLLELAGEQVLLWLPAKQGG